MPRMALLLMGIEPKTTPEVRLTHSFVLYFWKIVIKRGTLTPFGAEE